MKIQYRPFEMHCHTHHSDGRFSVRQLLEAAEGYGYEGICLTDHNTMSGVREAAQPGRNAPFVMPGIEWTTFYGHLLVLGGARYVDWRFVTPDTIDGALQEIREAGGIAGIAHPFEPGAPMSCGSFWEFHVTRWDLIHYIEVWSGESPHKRAKNRLSIPFYDRLLAEGYRIAVTAGRDWHGPDQGRRPILAATYLGVEGGQLTPEHVGDALRCGRTYITLGPELTCAIARDGCLSGLGDTVSPGRAEIHAAAGPGKPEGIWAGNGAEVSELRLVANGRIAAVSPPGSGVLDTAVLLERGWMRIEAWGTLEGATRRLALTSPVYIR